MRTSPPVLAITTALLTVGAWAAPEDGHDPLPAQVIQAHQGLDRVSVTASYTVYFSYPDETEFVSTDYRVWLDRPTQRLRIERPGFTLVCDGQTVFLRSSTIPDRHLEAPLDEDGLTYDALVDLVPDVHNPIPPALTLLLADAPMAWLSEGHSPTADALKPRDDDPRARPRIRLATTLGDLTLNCTPETLLLEDAVLVADPKQLQGSGLVDARFHHHIAIEPADAPFDDVLFVLETEGSTPMATMAQLLAPPPNPNANPGGGGPTLIGQALPDVALDTLEGDDPVSLGELCDQHEGVVIIEFFATWTRPSLTDLGDLVAYQDWAEEEELDIHVVTVNVMEKSKEVREWFERLAALTGIDYDLPVLLDVTGEAAIGLGLPALPRTVVLRDGEVVDVLGGIKPDFAGLLRERTPRWLGEEAEEEMEETN